VAAPATTAPFLMFCICTFVLVGRPQDFFPVLVPFRLALVTTALAAAMTLFGTRAPGPGLFETRETRLYFLFYAGMVAGIPFSVYRPSSFDIVILQYPINVAFFLMFLAHVDSERALKRVAVVLLLSVFLLNAFGIMHGTFSEGRYDIGSLMYDPNDVAFVEVSLLAFVLWIVAGPFHVLWKVIGIVSALSGMLITLFTASRGGLLGLLTFFALLLCLRVKTIGKLAKLGIVVSLVLVAVTNAEKINVDRLSTLNSIEDDYNFQERGRVDIWQRGWKLFLDDPVTGVGVNGFAKAIGDMRARESGTIPEWQTAHSAYILVLTETGILGSVPFLLLIVSSLLTFNRSRRTGAIAGVDLHGLPALLFVGFGAQLVTAAFLSQAYSMFFTLTFAMSGALHRMTQAAGVSRHASVARQTASAPLSWRDRAAQGSPRHPAAVRR
jgi:O-antigen ligase